MLIKIGDIVNQFGISHKSLHYWENAGILKSSRAENDYRYYDEENANKIKQIVALRKLELPIPVIQEVLESADSQNAVGILEKYSFKSGKEQTHLAAANIVISKLINMLNEGESVETICNYLNAVPENETEVLKTAMKIIISEPAKEIEISELTNDSNFIYYDLNIEDIVFSEIELLKQFIISCFEKIEHGEAAVKQFELEASLYMKDCRYNYKAIRNGTLVGAVQLEYIGRDCMCIKNIVVGNSEIHVPLYEAIRNKHPESILWFIRNRPGEPEHSEYDYEIKRQRFWEDNGFGYHTGHGHINYSNHRNITYVPSTPNLIQHCPLEKLTYRAVAIPQADIYDANMGGSRITDTNLRDSIIFDTGMDRVKFISQGMTHCEFSYARLNDSKFFNCNLNNVSIEKCDISGLTIDGINIEKAIKAYIEK